MKYIWMFLLLPVVVYAGGVAGTVIDNAGNPVEDVVIRFTPGDFEGLTDADGRFSIYPIKPGPKLMTVTLYGFEQYTELFDVRDDKLAETTVYLKRVGGLEEPGRLVGTVTAIGTGAPVAFVEISVVGANRATTTAKDGSYSIDYIQPGDYEVKFDKYTYFVDTADGMIKINSGETTTLDFELNTYETEKKW
ncbi:MAG: carboxypeptidase regulatory-like domain-containing protein [bacterium]|nr:carboxypeptidase regulatory-like domain-containing protein [bacterium]